MNSLRKIFLDPKILRAINFIPGNNQTFLLGISAVYLQPLFLLPCLSFPTHAAFPQEAIKQITILTSHSLQCALLFVTFRTQFCARSHGHKSMKRQVAAVVCDPLRSTIINYKFQFHIKILGNLYDAHKSRIVRTMD